MVIGFNKLIVKLEFVRERDIDSLRRGRVSRPFAQQPIYRFAPPFWEIFPLAAGGETPPLRPYKLEFVEVNARPEQHCHSEPVRTLVWESPSNSGQLIVIQTVVFVPFSGILPREVVCLTGGLPHQFANWLAMTGNSSNSNLSVCLRKIACIHYIVISH